MEIVVTYMIPVTVYIDTEDKRVRRVCVDDGAPMENGYLDGVDNGEGFVSCEDMPEEASKALIKRAEEIAFESGCDWPSWQFGY